ncbi:hypothetical protein RUM44_005535 [Polyplax serrata]|uniref:Gamma-tubulin complex component n=1 Tax=Polyplax serrata TaxID=468196 RepID=A0ABR1ADN5_POLSC
MRFGVTKAQGIDIYHEVLFALSGTKSAFSSYQFAVKELFQLSETVLLERILGLGQQYGKLKNFIDSIKSRQFKEQNKVGLYLLAFAEFLNVALTPYWDDIVMLEEEITNQPHNSLHFIWSKMHRHSELLSGLLSLVTSVITQGSYGCVVLQHLHQTLHSDIGATRAAVVLIVDGMNEIFFRQMSGWLLYGDLVDGNQEFFIHESSLSSKDGTPFERYSLNCCMLPTHIDIALASKILQVGQTVLFLRSNPAYSSSKEWIDTRSEICIDRSGLFGEKERKIQDKIAEVRRVYKWNENGMVERLVSNVSSLVTLQLWTLAVQDAKLKEQLHLVNDFFLLGRGELFHEFVSQADQYLSKSATGNFDLNLLLQESARKVLIKEETLQRLSLELVEDTNMGTIDDSEGEWNRLLVKYDAPWPLQLIFTHEACQSYNKIFRFLLRLKKIEVKLGQSWLTNKSKSHGEDNLKQRELHRNLCFLINNLQYYLHVDVLNSQFMIFEAVVETSKDFDRIQKAHEIFLQNLNSQLFLCVDLGESKIKNPIKKSINKILELCEDYCMECNSVEMREEKVNCMLARFEAFVEFLLNHLTRITSQAIHPSSQHLSQFLLRLDFNTFFSNQFSSSLTSVYF